MDPLKLLNQYYKNSPIALKILLTHSNNVTRKALRIAERVPELKPNIQFIEEAAMLHDIGIFLTYAPKIGCYGQQSYICHGYLGRELLDRHGLYQHALVCERHTGLGLSLEDIKNKNLPIPKRNMIPISVEEKIICFADKFYSKKPNRLDQEKTLKQVQDSLSKQNPNYLEKFNSWCRQFKEN